MNETMNALIKEQFGTQGVSEKQWLVMTDDWRNMAGTPVVDGRFHPAILLECIHGETKIDALMRFKSCFNQRCYAVVETVEEAKKLMPHSTIVNYDGKVIQRAECD